MFTDTRDDIQNDFTKYLKRVLLPTEFDTIDKEADKML